MEIEYMIQELELICFQMKKIAYGTETVPQPKVNHENLNTPIVEAFGVGINEDGQLGILNEEENGGYACTAMFRKIQATFVNIVCGSIFSMGLNQDNVV
jgi:hypothetical protein